MGLLRNPSRRVRRLWLVGVVLTLAVSSAGLVASPATGEEEEALKPPEPTGAFESLVEFTLPDRDALQELVLLGADLVETVNDNEDGTVGVYMYVTAEEREYYEALGFEAGETLEDYSDYLDRMREREVLLGREEAALEVAEEGEEARDGSDESQGESGFFSLMSAPEFEPPGEVTIQRADYFENYAGRFLSVEAHNALGTVTGGPTMAVAWRTETGDYGTATTMTKFNDQMNGANNYMYHRVLIRIGTAGSISDPDRPIPASVRVASSTGEVREREVRPWPGGGLPPRVDEYLYAFPFTFETGYKDPVQVFEYVNALEDEFDDLADIIDLPNLTNGYRRKAQALLDPPGNRLSIPLGPAAGTYTYAAATYGPAVPAGGFPPTDTPLATVTADPNPDFPNATPSQGCGTITGFPAGSIALVDRGECTFALKTLNAQNAGAVAVVIVNNVAGAPTSPGGTALPGTAISTVMISLADGSFIKANLPASGRLIPGTAVSNAARVGVDSLAWGHEGGNDITIQAVDPGVPDSPLSVEVTGNHVTVNLATNASGARTSTASQVVAAINASPGASALVFAYTFRGNAGGGVVNPTQLIRLSDNLNAPAEYARGPQQPQVIRIGKHRDGSKVGVFLFCQEHAREWVTPLSCVETAEQLLRNYAIDPMVKELVDNLDIFILPSYNPDGSLYSMYDFPSQRRNMTRYCPVTGSYDVLARNAWGVDNNRNLTVGSLFDGYAGASTSCTSDVYAGPAELSEPEAKNEHWIVDTFSNIKFSNNIHTFGGYFMWSPGSYVVTPGSPPGRTPLPHPNIGVEGYFFAAADTVLGRIKELRQTVVAPQRTGPIADVLYSAAGNSADDQWYRKGIIAYSFEAGSQLFNSTETGTSQSDVGFFPNFLNEGRHEAVEFAFGNFGLLEEALKYANDDEAPVADIVPNGSPNVAPDGWASQSPIAATFEWVNEPSKIFYTVDGSTPTQASLLWEAQGPRRPGQVFRFEETTTLRWIAEDIKGNVSDVRSATFHIDVDAPDISITSPVDGEQYLIDSTVNADYECTDLDSGVEVCDGTVADGSPIDTSTVGFQPFQVDAEDYAGNTASEAIQYQVIWPFSGFLAPMNGSGVTTARAGSTVPVRFELGGDRGLGILEAGSPTSRQVDCTSGEPLGDPASTMSNSGLVFEDGKYKYEWRTQRQWAGTCRELSLALVDGTTRTAIFRFT
ncbi:MAG: PxKF domain-containing protein [Actinomycetota bacterium]